ncbi:MAG: lipoyl(octanoyl) transferase [Myxococcota bacterium]|jgi:lipoyl(octanoyl) transferase
MAVLLGLDGLSDYQVVHDLQEAMVEAVGQHTLPDVILLLEHPATITVGRAQHALANVIDRGDIPVVPIKRGGDVTLHAPGQLVAYPIVALPEGKRDLLAHMKALEEACITLCASLGLTAIRDERNTGAWLTMPNGRNHKVGSIGIACRSWVTWHGLALNIDIDLSLFDRIHPCGFQTNVMTRLADHLTTPPSLGSLTPVLGAHVLHALGLAPSTDSERQSVLDWVRSQAPTLSPRLIGELS